MKFFLPARLLAVALLLTAPAAAQVPAWQSGLQSTNLMPTDGTSASGQAVATDATGRVYVGGSYGDESATGPATRSFGSAGTVGPGLGGFIAQASAAGQWSWVTPAVATGTNMFGRTVAGVSSVATTPGGDVYAAGYASGTTLTVGTVSQPLGTTGDAVWVARFDAAGVCQWLRVVANGRDEPRAAADPSTGGVVVGGVFQQPITFGTTTLTGSPGGRTRTIYVARLNAAGQWTSAVASAGPGRIERDFSLAVGPAGQVAVGGSYSGGSVQFGPATLPAPVANDEAFCVAQLSAADQWQWAVAGSGSSFSAIYQVAYTLAGEVWAAGEGESGTVVGPATIITVGSGSLYDQGGFIGLLSTAGQWVMSRVLASSSLGSVVLGPLAVDSRGNALVLGGLGGPGSAQLALDARTLTAPADSILFFVSTLNRAGRWGAVTPLPLPALAYGLSPTRIALDNAGNLYAVGSFTGALTLGTATLSGTYDPASGDGSDVLLAKLGNATALPTRATAPAGTLACFPSPAHATATLRLPGSSPQDQLITITDALGRPVRQATLPAATTQTALDLRGLAPGLYLVRCGAATGKVVVE